RCLSTDNGKERWRRQEHPAKYPPTRNHKPLQRPPVPPIRNASNKFEGRSVEEALTVVHGLGNSRWCRRDSQGTNRFESADRHPPPQEGLPTFHDRRPSCTNGAMTI